MAASDIISLTIKVVKGNKLASLVTESHEIGEFQAALNNGVDINKAVRVKEEVAAIGSRGDYIELTKLMAAAGATDKNTLFVEGLDFTAVPTAVQHTVFGEFTKFKTPKSSMQESMLDGIDRQEVSFSNNVGLGGDPETTGVAQKLRGVADARVHYYANGVDTAFTELYLKLKPLSDGVFVIPAGAILWCGAATTT